MQSLFNRLAGLENVALACDFIKKRLQHRYSKYCEKMNIAKSLRAPFFTEHLRLILLLILLLLTMSLSNFFTEHLRLILLLILLLLTMPNF